MMDQTGPWTTDKNGNDIWYQNDVLKDPKTAIVEDIMADQKKRYEIRVHEAKALGAEIKEQDFMVKLGLGAGTPVLDIGKLFITG